MSDLRWSEWVLLVIMAISLPLGVAAIGGMIVGFLARVAAEGFQLGWTFA